RKSVDEEFENSLLLKRDVAGEEDSGEVLRVAPVAHHPPRFVNDPPVERDREPEEVVVVGARAGVDEADTALVDRISADEHGARHHEVPEADELDERVGIAIPVPLTPREGLSGRAVERLVVPVDEADVRVGDHELDLWPELPGEPKIVAV